MIHLNEIIKEITDWKLKNPDTYFYKLEMVARELKYVLTAATNSAIDQSFNIRMSALLNKSLLSDNQNRIIQNYLKAKTIFVEAERDLIKLLTSDFN